MHDTVLLGWCIKRKSYDKLALHEDFHEIVMRRFGEMTIFSVGQHAFATNQHENTSVSLSAWSMISLPIEVFEAMATYLTLPELWWLTRSIGAPNRYHTIMARRVRANLAPFFVALDSFYKCVKACDVYIMGDVVTRMILGGSWREQELSLAVSRAQWDPVKAYLNEEGFSIYPAKDHPPLILQDVYDLLFLKNENMVRVYVYDEISDTPEDIAANNAGSTIMPFLTASGFTIPFAELTFANLAALRPEEYNAEEPVSQQVGWLEAMGLRPLTIANRVVTTRDLHRMRPQATRTMSQKVKWAVNWQP
jgi:hypothetical protein